MTYGFIGCGNMAGAIINALLDAKFLERVQINIFDVNEDNSVAFAKKSGVNRMENYEALIQGSDVVVLGVKPFVLPRLLTEAKDLIKQYAPLVVSIAASKTIAEIETLLGFAPPIVRVMPNMNAKVLQCMSGICKNAAVTEAQHKIVTDMFGAIGETMDIDEELFGAFTVIASCSPAFTYMYIDALARAAVKLGLNKKQALKIAAQTTLGSAKTLLETDEHPWELIDRVCSPRGMTIEGVSSLQRDGFEAAVAAAVEKAFAKS